MSPLLLLLLFVPCGITLARAKDPEIEVWSAAMEKRSTREWERSKSDMHFWIKLNEKEKAARRLLLEASTCEYGTPFDRTRVRPGGQKMGGQNKYARSISVRVPQCETPGDSIGRPFLFCAANMHCTNNYASFSILDIICAADADGNCPDAKTCALNVELEMERPAPVGDKPEMILERFPMRGSPQEVQVK